MLQTLNRKLQNIRQEREKDAELAILHYAKMAEIAKIDKDITSLTTKKVDGETVTIALDAMGKEKLADLQATKTAIMAAVDAEKAAFIAATSDFTDKDFMLCQLFANANMVCEDADAKGRVNYGKPKKDKKDVIDGWTRFSNSMERLVWLKMTQAAPALIYQAREDVKDALTAIMIVTRACDNTQESTHFHSVLLKEGLTVNVTNAMVEYMSGFAGFTAVNQHNGDDIIKFNKSLYGSFCAWLYHTYTKGCEDKWKYTAPLRTEAEKAAQKAAANQANEAKPEKPQEKPQDAKPENKETKKEVKPRKTVRKSKTKKEELLAATA